MRHAGWPLPVCTYAALVLATLAIVGNEICFPCRDIWAPHRTQVMDDVIFLSVVNVLWPKALAFAAALCIVELNRLYGWATMQIWPSGLPQVVQFVLLLLSIDFGRYWLHRAAHTFEFLWRFHAVHHSPKGLYALNAGRFHPVEVSLQFFVDVVPFIVIGAPPAILALYFLVYAINGFYKHANCRVRLGILNQIISGPELHRWHHSRRPAESCANYGTNLIVWDHLFGTRYAPDDRVVDELGLVNRAYPTGFLRQMITPFSPGLDKT
jgi:sterol desaturase/sphingolipid hydroxylase (fatty acid hydroxylase superfamily)